MGTQDFIGNRGQSIAHMRLTAMCRKNGMPWFEAHFLGDKCPTFDFLVELIGAGERRPYFFIQVKATRAGFTTIHPPRLKTKVPKSDVRKMALFRAPTYVIGVDEPGERAYVIAVFGRMRESISSISTQHQLNPLTLKALWEEVRDYWKGRNMHQQTSRFVN
jgi:hypothetical protein